ncbi:MAG: hypothetical protein IPG57_13260 [Burkholderiales bacterium]|jgi:hypothetical protein|nr:hypothetical protein [Burkholderiales bacterium]
MKRPPLILSTALAAALLALGGCGESAQTISSGRISDAKPWEGPATADAYTAAGWKAGDAEAWHSQIRSRMLNQNEYTRTAGRAP